MTTESSSLRARSAALFDDIEAENTIAHEVGRALRTAPFEANATADDLAAPSPTVKAEHDATLAHIMPTVVDCGATGLLRAAVATIQAQTAKQRALLGVHYRRLDVAAAQQTPSSKRQSARHQTATAREAIVFDEQGRPLGDAQ